jgi:hypothetical protein
MWIQSPWLTLARQSETLRPSIVPKVGVMMRIGTAAILVAIAGMVALPSGLNAQTAPAGVRMAQAAQPGADAPRRARPLRRVPVYPRYEPGPDDVYPHYFPGSDAVRECNATYVQEYRPSGTVIVPRMSCHWRRG